jgi:hypothetical protein
MKHHPYGPSQLSAIALCPGRVKACEGLEDTQTEYAIEGTRLHNLAEKILRHYIGAIPIDVSDAPKEIIDYVEYILKLPGQLFIEHEVQYGNYIPDGFGTCDGASLTDDELHIVDLKTGHIFVSPVENMQLLTYALSFPRRERTFLHIYQPYVNNINVWETTGKRIDEWGEELKAIYKHSIENQDLRLPGEKQCQWCKASPQCKELLEHTTAIVKSQFDDRTFLPKDPMSLTVEQLEMITLNRSLIESWLEKVENRLFEIVSQYGSDQFVIGEGRKSRSWKEGTEKILVDIFGDGIYEKSILSPAKFEKKFGNAASEYVVTKNGKLKLIRNKK